MVCPVNPDLQDDDWSYIVSEFSMNYSTDSLRLGYHQMKEKAKKESVDVEQLRELGYSEEDIAKAENVRR